MSILPTQMLFRQVQRRNCVHDPLAQPRVAIFSACLKICVREINRLADDDGDFAPQMNFSVNRPGIEGSENSHRNNRGARFRDKQAQAGQGWMQIPIRRTRSFRKNERTISRAQNSNQCFERAAIAPFQILRNDVELGQEPS